MGQNRVLRSWPAGQPPWGYQQPFLTFKEDFPAPALGYKLPTFRLAIEVE